MKNRSQVYHKDSIGCHANKLLLTLALETSFSPLRKTITFKKTVGYAKQNKSYML